MALAAKAVVQKGGVHEKKGGSEVADPPYFLLFYFYLHLQVRLLNRLDVMTDQLAF